jgi:hypothetical protein
MTITKDSSISFPVKTRGKSWIGQGADPGWQVDLNKIITLTRTRTGTRLPHYRDILEAGGNATTSMNATWDSLDYGRTRECRTTSRYNLSPYYISDYRVQGDVAVCNSNWTLKFFNPSVGINFVDNLARSAFYKKLHNIETQFQGAVFLGELRETLKLLRHPLEGIHNLSKNFLGNAGKRKRSNSTTWKKDLGALWLEQSFGWKPLMNDISDAVKAYERLVKPKQTRQVSAGAAKDYDTSQAALSSFEKVGALFTYPTVSGCYYRTTNSILREKHKVRYKGALRAQVNAPRWQNSDLFGFEPKDWIPAAWELLPWSFLADYFTNIGDILDASIVSTRDVAWVNKTEIRTTEHYGTYELVPSLSYPQNGLWTFISSSGDRCWHVSRRKVVQRTANAGYPRPTLQFNFNLTDGQLGNVAALLSQANALYPQAQPRPWRGHR